MPHRYSKTQSQETMQDRSTQKEELLRMGGTYLYQSQEGWYRMVHLGLQGTKQKDIVEALSYSKNSRFTAESRRIPVCNKS